MIQHKFGLKFKTKFQESTVPTVTQKASKYKVFTYSTHCSYGLYKKTAQFM